ncbi:MFS general substrate transporter [Cristinia sonorae]|uniref:MFS general substrate transporter n=1 Tax=Cristinia sonorae TaxID=1940300 RepID=A0A8K0UX67_9AGAR|nr:MFS general substrate transporter [Cristinia sonorae]
MMSDQGKLEPSVDATLTDEKSVRDLESGPVETAKDDKGSVEDAIETPPVAAQALLNDPPDGGFKAWSAVFGAACGAFATFGYVNAWGVFQSYYEEQILRDTSPSTIAWIGSIEYALILAPGLLTGRMFDRGYVRLPISIASATLVASTFLTAECKKYWQFLLCQGILAGASCGIIFGPMMGLTSQWFKRKRGIALGCLAIGSSVGGTVFPIAARHLIQIVGFKWMMRILGFIQLAALTITFLTVKRRLPPSPASTKMFDLNIFKSPAYSIYSLSSLIMFLGLYTVLTFIDVSAILSGISPEFSFYLVSIANASSGLGRFAGGALADKAGAMNVLIPSSLVAAVLTYAWPFAKSKGDFVAIAIIYGAFSGVYISLMAAPLMSMGNAGNVGIMVGWTMTILSAGAIAGPPISGAINAATKGYKDVGYYAGSMIVLSCLLMSVVRYIRLGKFIGKI